MYCRLTVLSPSCEYFRGDIVCVQYLSGYILGGCKHFIAAINLRINVLYVIQLLYNSMAPTRLFFSLFLHTLLIMLTKLCSSWSSSDHSGHPGSSMIMGIWNWEITLIIQISLAPQYSMYCRSHNVPFWSLLCSNESPPSPSGPFLSSVINIDPHCSSTDTHSTSWPMWPWRKYYGRGPFLYIPACVGGLYLLSFSAGISYIPPVANLALRPFCSM